MGASLPVLSTSPASIFQRSGAVVLCVEPGQASKAGYVAEAAMRHPGLGHLAFVARELAPEAIHFAASHRLAELGYNPDQHFSFSVTDGRGRSDAELAAGLENQARQGRPFGGIFSPLDRYVRPTSLLARSLAAHGALSAGRTFLNPEPLQAIMDKSGFREIMDTIDPDGARFAHPTWEVLPIEKLTAAHLQRQFGQTGGVYVLPLRGASKRGVSQIDLADHQLGLKLARARADIQWWRGTPGSGVEDDSRVLAVRRVKGREFSIEVAKQGSQIHILQIHWKGDQGDATNPDGTFERIYLSKGTSLGGVTDDPAAALLESTTLWMMQRMTACGYDIGDGVFHLEARIDHESGKPYFIEFNPRPGGSAVPDMVRVASRDAISIYGLQLCAALGVPMSVQAHRYRPAADLTLFAEGVPDGAGMNEFSGFVLIDPVAGGEREVAGMSSAAITDVLQTQLRDTPRASADAALVRAVALGYPSPDGDAFLTAFRRPARWNGVQARLIRFEPWVHAGQQFKGGDSTYLGNVLAEGDEGLERVAAQAHLVSAMALIRQMLVGRAQQEHDQDVAAKSVPLRIAG